MATGISRETAAARLDVHWARAHFPSLRMHDNGPPAIILEGPAGTQVPQRVMDAVRNYFEQSNANTCGAFVTSRRSDAMIAATRAAIADLLNCGADEVFFGPNMTTITFALARAIGRELAQGDEIVVTTLDHDANVAPWRALEERGVVVRQADIREEDCTLDLDDLRRKITSRTKLVAVGYASNAVGTINPVEQIVKLAHAVGAEVFLDAVHYAPHGPIDVRALDCDYLVCSGYKVFAPHMGFAWCRREAINRLPTFREHFIPDVTPDKLEAGTYAYENVAGMDAAVGYLEDLGRSQAGESRGTSRAEAIK